MITLNKDIEIEKEEYNIDIELDNYDILEIFDQLDTEEITEKLESRGFNFDFDNRFSIKEIQNMNKVNFKRFLCDILDISYQTDFATVAHLLISKLV